VTGSQCYDTCDLSSLYDKCELVTPSVFTDDKLLTIEEAVDKIGFGVFQVLLSVYIGATGVCVM